MKIFTRPYLLPSARVLARLLSELSGRAVFATSISRRVTSSFIRWGNSDSVGTVNDLGLNQAAHISICANKRGLSELLVGSGVPTVEFHRDTPSTFPVVVRQTMSGFGGRGIQVCRNADDFEPYSGNWWSPWYEFEYELGVHVLGGRIEKIMKKVRSDGTQEEDFPIRNMRRGYHFKRVGESPGSFAKLRAFVEQFHSSFGIHYGRLDVGWDSVHRTYRVIEFNSAPGLSENQDTLQRYAEYIYSEIR